VPPKRTRSKLPITITDAHLRAIVALRPL
jgi:hypothetical protein